MFQVSDSVAIEAAVVMAIALGGLFFGVYLFFKRGIGVGANIIAGSFVIIIAVGATLLIILLTR